MRATIALVSALAASFATPLPAPAGDVDFERHIAPLLVRRCVRCHDSSQAAGGLNLTDPATAAAGGLSKEPALVPGKPADSYLLARAASGEMPPEGKDRPLDKAELAQLETWIAAGARWPAGRVLSVFEFSSDQRAGRDWWSLSPPRLPAIPPVRDLQRVRTPIDALVLARLEAQGLALSPEADRATLIRRATLDLWGLPPDVDQIEAFVADASPDAYERLIERLLASPRYGERWARHWLDVVRFGESNGYETNTARPNSWPYRDWLIDALNDDLPYPEFVLRQLAGDQVGVDEATGYLVGGAHDMVGSPDVELTMQQRLNDLDDIVSTTAGAMLGLTVGCAKCHDHKFDPIAQRDYYALQAIFAGVQHGERDWRRDDYAQRQQQQAALRAALLDLRHRQQLLTLRNQPLAQTGGSGAAPVRASVDARLNVDRFAPVTARFLRFTVLATSQGEPCLDELEVFTADESARNVALAEGGAKATSSSVYAGGRSELHQLRHVHDGRYGNASSWISAEPGAGWVQIEWPDPARVDCVAWARDREGKFRDRLATRYRIELSLDGQAWQLVASDEDRQPVDHSANNRAKLDTSGWPPLAAAQFAELSMQAAALDKQIEQVAVPKVYAGTFSQPGTTHLLFRGEPLQKRQEISPGALSYIGRPLSLSADLPEAERRVALARWIGSADNPLSARVMVNRIWQHHFGQGLVNTPSDFGFGGGRPSHGELLDWLAVQFVERGWRPKQIHRLIMLSSVYRQAAAPHEVALAVDAGNRLLWRYAPRRLEAEVIRDSMLWSSGSLDLRMGGPGYDVFEPNTNYVKVYAAKQSFGPAEWRRMVYQNKPRLRQDATFGEFDCPDASQAMSRRNVSTTALQALNLFNGPFALQQSQQFADRLTREAGPDVDTQVRSAFWLAFGRAADETELAAAGRLVRNEGLLALCRALFNANEFLYAN